jgi:Holliday junction resolvasome RuvABC ATP-dependent DNA helicase subunit
MKRPLYLRLIRSRGTPRDTEYYTARRVRDFAQIKGNGTIDIEIAKYIKGALNVDALVLMKWITRF